MKRTRHLFLVLFALAATTAQAQTDQETWLENQRPECFTMPQGTASPALAPRRIGSQATASLKSIGVQRIPVVLAAFSDVTFSVADTKETDADGNTVVTAKGTDEEVNAFYQLYCNGTRDGKRYTGHGSYGSLRDYFVQQSDSIFLPEFVVIGPVQLDSASTYYGKNNGSTKDVNYTKFRNEALTKAMALHDDWDSFDNDGNGSIDMVFFIYAGMAESNTSGQYPNLIWPKDKPEKITFGGYTFAASAATCEARPLQWNDGKTEVIATRTDGVGVALHELSHGLGLPDFYDTNNKAFGMDLWSIMDYGEYGANGYCPSGYTAYERDFMGWQPLVELTDPCILTIPCFAAGGTGYRISNPANADEYYVIENRQPMGWDTTVGAYGHGLMVTHVDYLASRWNGNTVNTDGSHQRMTIIAANDRYIGTNTASAEAKKNGTTAGQEWYKTLGGNLYPGDTYNYNLTDDSTPAAELYTGGLLGKPLRNITENEDGTITLCFRTNGQLEVPEVTVSDIDMTSFTATWGEVENATKYAVELYRDEARLALDTLTELSRSYGDLPPSSNLKLRVRALADMPEDYLDGEWSDFVHFQTLVDLIASTPESDKLVDVYNAGGVLVSHCHADELNRLSLRRGIYIIRYSNGAARRVLIR